MNEEKYNKMRAALISIAEAIEKDTLPNDPKSLMLIGALAPNLGDFLEKLGLAILSVADILDEK